jgi:hypothetical protein
MKNRLSHKIASSALIVFTSLGMAGAAAVVTASPASATSVHHGAVHINRSIVSQLFINIGQPVD